MFVFKEPQVIFREKWVIVGKALPTEETVLLFLFFSMTEEKKKNTLLIKETQIIKNNETTFHAENL